MNVIASRFIVLKLLRGFVDCVTSFDEIQEKLEYLGEIFRLVYLGRIS